MIKNYLFSIFFIFSIAKAQSPAESNLNFTVPGAPPNYYSFNNDTFQTFYPSVVKALVQPDGKIIVNSGKGLERIDGNVKDLSFNVLLQGESYNPDYYRVYDMVLQPDGKIIVSGEFIVSCNGSPVKKIFRLMPNGALDPSFQIEEIAASGGLALQPDGKILADIDGVLKRLQPNGAFDNTFAVPEGERVYYSVRFELLPNGKIVFQSGLDGKLKMLNDDGSYDAGFHDVVPPVNTEFKSFKMLSDGKILVGGGFVSYDNIAAPGIMRLNGNGTVDNTFSATGNGFPLNILTSVNDISILQNGQILLALSGSAYITGEATSYSGLIKLNGNGEMDPAFRMGIAEEANSSSDMVYVSLLSDGKFLAQRIANAFDFQFDGIVKINPDGTKDSTFNNGPGFSESVTVILPLPDNKILVGGDFTDFSGSRKKHLVRINSDGSDDASFSTGIGFGYSRGVSALALQTDGKIIVAGFFLNFNGQTSSGILRLNSNGSLDESFQQQTEFYNVVPQAVVLQPDGKIIVGGTFHITKGQQTWQNIIRLNSDGTIDTTFHNGSVYSYGLNGGVRAIALQASGKIVIGGEFTGQYNCVGCGTNKRVMRINADGSFDTTFNYSVGSTINALAIEADGNILIGQSYAGAGNNLIRITSEGYGINFGETFDIRNDVYTIFVQPDGKIIVGGKLYSARDSKVKNLVRVFPNGNIDPDFNTGSGFNREVKTIAMQANGRILVGGNFTTYNGQMARRMAGLKGDDFYVMRGENKLDADNNGCTAADINFPYLKLLASNGTVNIPNSSGSYAFAVGQGSYTFTPQFENPSYFTASPESVTIAFPAAENPTTQNFCILPNGSHTDLEVVLLPVNVARPGFLSQFKLIYKNKGNQTQSGNLTLNFNGALQSFVSALPTTTSATAQQLAWNFANLKPFEQREIVLSFRLNTPTATPPVHADDVLNYTAIIAGNDTDEIPADNTFILNQTVLNALDPNDKTCLEGTNIGVEKVGDYVHYMIRFENTGNYAAQNIIVTDIIDTAKFDMATLTPISGSHLFVTRIKDGKTEFVFENINLPFADETNDGYVAFKIKTKSGLQNGDAFSNGASIYFDYNAAVDTNVATTVIGTLSTTNLALNSYFAVYPNPATDFLMIQNKKNTALQSIEIYNISGQRVLVIPNAKGLEKLDVSQLKTGSYFLKIHSEKGNANLQFLKK